MKNIFFSAIIFLLISQSYCFGQEMSCQDLKRYRDELPKMYADALEREKQKYDGLQDLKSTCASLLSELKADRKTVKLGGIALGVKNLADRAIGLLSLAPGGGKVAFVYDLTTSTIQKGVKGAITAAGAEGLNKFLGKYTSSATAIIRQAASTAQVAASTAKNVNGLIENATDIDDYEKAKASMNSEIRKMEAAIAEIDEKIKSAQPKSDEMERYISYIDGQLSKICK